MQERVQLLENELLKKGEAISALLVQVRNLERTAQQVPSLQQQLRASIDANQKLQAQNEELRKRLHAIESEKRRAQLNAVRGVEEGGGAQANPSPPSLRPPLPNIVVETHSAHHHDPHRDHHHPVDEVELLMRQTMDRVKLERRYDNDDRSIRQRQEVVPARNNEVRPLRGDDEESIEQLLRRLPCAQPSSEKKGSQNSEEQEEKQQNTNSSGQTSKAGAKSSSADLVDAKQAMAAAARLLHSRTGTSHDDRRSRCLSSGSSSSSSSDTNDEDSSSEGDDTCNPSSTSRSAVERLMALVRDEVQLEEREEARNQEEQARLLVASQKSTSSGGQDDKTNSSVEEAEDEAATTPTVEEGDEDEDFEARWSRLQQQLRGKK